MSVNQDTFADPIMSRKAVSEAEPFLRSLIGSAVLLLAADFAEPIFFGQGYYSGLSVHPYWIIVLLAAVQSGLYVGVAIAGLAALLMDWPTRPLGIDITTHYIDTAILPLQWLIAALVIGMFRQGQLRDEAKLRQDNQRLIRMSDDMAREVLRLDAALARSELAAVTRPEDMADHQSDFIIRCLSRLAEATRQMQSKGGEALPLSPVAVLIENDDGGFEVEGDGVICWFPEERIVDTHPVALAVKDMKEHVLVRTDDASFLCWALPRCGAHPINGTIAAVVTDESRIDDMKDWLRLLAPLISVALNPEADLKPTQSNPALEAAAKLAGFLKDKVS